MKDPNRLFKIMAERNLSQQQLQRMSGVSKTAIGKIANFEADPRQTTMIALARALKLDVSEVFNLNWRR